MPGEHHSWRRVAVTVAVALLFTLGASPVTGSPAPGADMTGGETAPPLHQNVDVTPGPELRAEQKATAVAILSRQGAEGVESLQRLSAVTVHNPLPTPERVVDVAATQTAAAEAEVVSATATAAAATEVAPSVEATVAAHATATASAAASATVTAAARKPATPVAATPVASAPRATPVAAAALAAVTPPTKGNRPDWAEPALAPLALLPLLSALLGVAIWRRRSEPFVLKAKPARAEGGI